MFTTLIVQPLFNLLVFIYAIIPGHNFGVAIILFTITIRLIMWPLVKKQLYHAKTMRDLQPELKKIKQKTKGNKQQESLLVMELYKEKGISPFASIGLVLLQLPIFIALFSALNRIVNDPNTLISFSYPFVQNLSWMKQLAGNIQLFDNTLLGIVDLWKPAIGGGNVYIPALVLVIGSAVAQYFQGKQLMPEDKDSKTLRQILRDAKDGKQTEQAEMSAATSRFTRFLMPAIILIFTIGFAAALSLYWLTTSVVALIQQSRILKKDEEKLEEIADQPTKPAIEGEVIPPKKTKKSAKKRKRKRR